MDLFTKTEFSTWTLHLIWWSTDDVMVMKMKSKFWGFKLLLRHPCFCYVLVKNAAQRSICPAAEGVPSQVPHLHESFCSSCWSSSLWNFCSSSPGWFLNLSSTSESSPDGVEGQGQGQALHTSDSLSAPHAPAALISQEAFEPTDLLLPVVCWGLHISFLHF